MMKKLGAVFILVIFILITFFFSTKLDGLVISGDFTAFFPWDEYTDYYEGGIGGQKAVLATSIENDDALNINTDYIVSRDYRTKLSASVSLVPDEVDETYTSTMYVLVYSEDLYSPDILNTLEECIDEIDSRLDSARPQSILDWFTLSGEDGFLMVLPMSTKEGNYWTESEASEFEKRVENDPLVSYYLVGGSGNSFILQFLYADKASSEQIDDISSLFDPLREKGARVILMSNMVIADEVIEALKRDLLLLAVLALLVMIVVYFLSFRSLRAVVLPFLISASSIVWTLGTMSILGLELNLLSILTPCLTLILGSTYSMHILNEYYLMGKKGEYDVLSSSKHIVITIVLGSITTILGFLAIAFAPSGTLWGFGVSVSAGVFYSAFLSVFCLPALLFLLPQPKAKKREALRRGIMQRIVSAWAEKVTEIWPFLVILFFSITLLFFFVKDRISVDSNYMSYFSEDDEFGMDCRFFSSEIGGTTPFTVTINAPEGSENFFLEYENLRLVFEWEEEMKEDENVLQIISFPQYVAFASRELLGEYEIPSDKGVLSILRSLLLSYSSSFSQLGKVVSPDFNTLTITVQTWDAEERDLITSSSIEEVYSRMANLFSLLPEGTEVAVSGYPVISEKFSSRLLSDQKISTLLSMVSILIVASLFLLSLSRGALVLVPVVAGIMINYIFMYFMNIPFDIITVSFSSVAIGCGVDDALHFSLRYRRYMKKYSDTPEIVQHTVRNTGRPIILTTLSIVSGMMMLSFGSYMPIRYFGLLMSVTLTATMLSTLLFLPSFILFFDWLKSFFDGRAYMRRDRIGR